MYRILMLLLKCWKYSHMKVRLSFTPQKHDRWTLFWEEGMQAGHDGEPFMPPAFPVEAAEAWKKGYDVGRSLDRIW